MTIQQFTELHVWIGIRPNGDERIVTVPSPRGGNFALVSNERADMEKLRDLAEKTLIWSRSTTTPFARIELRMFRVVIS